MGICSFSSRLDKYHNSVRGTLYCTELSNALGLHNFNIDHKSLGEHLMKRKDDNILEGQLQYACAIGDIAEIRRQIFIGTDLDQADYDGRTPLHLAVSEGHFDIVKLLLVSGLKNINPIDRRGNTPLTDAKRYNNIKIYDFLKLNGGLKAS